ncbi:hypothetical protein D3Z51_09605 [Clostridiaceae bacterium]|nr:hypothetical protein [Clostridiaceae bacterium]RKI14105.1 hypothetical protein D7V81_09090 [bacterium 1XD21-70]
MFGKNKKIFEQKGIGRNWRTLGIIGAGRGTGVTHFAVWAANYLTGVRRGKTAVLEWNRHGDFMHMAGFCGSIGKEMPYKILEADYYVQAGAKELAECLNGNYRYIIVDYGEITGQGFTDCARCDLKVIVGSLSEWRAEAFLKVVREGEKRDKSWKYAAVFGSEETRESIEKSYRIPVWRIPCAKDAFSITYADMIFLKELLGD